MGGSVNTSAISLSMHKSTTTHLSSTTTTTSATTIASTACTVIISNVGSRRCRSSAVERLRHVERWSQAWQDSAKSSKSTGSSDDACLEAGCARLHRAPARLLVVRGHFSQCWGCTSAAAHGMQVVEERISCEKKQRQRGRKARPCDSAPAYSPPYGGRAPVCCYTRS